MRSVIDAIVGILMIVMIGSAATTIYRRIKMETVRKVHAGQPSLEAYTRKLTGTRLNF